MVDESGRKINSVQLLTLTYQTRQSYNIGSVSL